MVNGRFLIAGVGCFVFSLMLFGVLKFSPPDLLQKSTSQQGIEWLYFLHMASAVVGVILFVIGIFKKPST